MTELRFPLAPQPAPIQIDNGAASAAIATAKAQEASDAADAAHGDRLVADAAAETATQKAQEASDDADAAHGDRLAADAAAETATQKAQEASDDADAAHADRLAADADAAATADIATNAAASAAGALSSLTSLLAKWLGASAADPTQDGAGNPLVDGALYFSSSVMRLKARVSGAWVVAVNTILPTTGAPSSGAGVDGDFAIDSNAGNLYGPKAAGAWPAPKSLVGPSPAPGGSDGNVQFKSGSNFAGSNSLFWNSANGRLGIGLSVPQQILDVLGTIRVTANGSTYLEMTSSGYNMVAASPLRFDHRGSGQDVIFRTSNSGTLNVTPLTIRAAGNVGIGIAAPTVTLDVDGPICVKSYTVATVPSAAAKAGQHIYVSNEVGGAVPAFSDGTNWRRCTDRAIVSA